MVSSFTLYNNVIKDSNLDKFKLWNLPFKKEVSLEGERMMLHLDSHCNIYSTSLNCLTIIMHFFLCSTLHSRLQRLLTSLTFHKVSEPESISLSARCNFNKFYPDEFLE